MINSEEYKYFSFDSENSVLVHEIYEENFGTREAFILSMSSFTTLIDKFRPRSILVKIFKKPDFFELELQSFMKATSYKLIENLGIKKVAFFISDEKYMSALKSHERNDTLKARFFLDLEEAIKWLVAVE
jgi:hypothetical protein